MKGSPAARHAKDLLISMHVLTSIGWGVMAVAQLALLGHGLSSDAPERLRIYEIALFLENNMLDPLAIIAVYTGMMLAAMTPWGYFRHWWVLVKFVLSWASILTAAIFISEWLPQAIEETRTGQDAPITALLVGTISMITSVVLMAWISIVKPWGKRGDNRRRRIDLRPGIWTFVAVLLVPVVEWVVRLDYPLMTGLTVLIYPIYRAHKLRRLERETAAKPPAHGARVAEAASATGTAAR